jgi:superfamily I DNA and/or RNA helicase
MAHNAVKDETLKGFGRAKKHLEILIVTFFQSQAQRYRHELDALLFAGRLKTDELAQIIVHTVDEAQHIMADLVFVDSVRNDEPGITADRRALCVAMTRARHAEVIVMNGGTLDGKQPVPDEMPEGHDPTLLKRIYQDVEKNGGVLAKVADPVRPWDDDNNCIVC